MNTTPGRLAVSAWRSRQRRDPNCSHIGSIHVFPFAEYRTPSPPVQSVSHIVPVDVSEHRRVIALGLLSYSLLWTLPYRAHLRSVRRSVRGALPQTGAPPAPYGDERDSLTRSGGCLPSLRSAHCRSVMSVAQGGGAPHRQVSASLGAPGARASLGRVRDRRMILAR